MNLIQITFCLATALMMMASALINYLESKLPAFFSQTFRYGKFATVQKSKLAIEVPKAWFKHFYVLAFFVYTYVFGLVTLVYVWNVRVPGHVNHVLDAICGPERNGFTPKRDVFLAVLLLTLQVYRRFYDTQKVSVFGENAKMNFVHYVVGITYYPATALAILCEAPLFSESPAYLNDSSLDLMSASWSEILVVILFVIAWKHQYNCTCILANLRKNKAGTVTTNEYKLPQGDWFEYLSCPHQTAEIIMYSCLMWLLWNNITWFFVFTWVLSNQVETILLSHWWYQEKFDDFPPKRKALIPFLY